MVEGDRSIKDFPLERCFKCKKETRILFPFRAINIDKRPEGMSVNEYLDKMKRDGGDMVKLCIRCNPITVELGLLTEDNIINMTEEQKAGMINYTPQIAHLNIKKVQSVAFDLGKGILDIPKGARISATQVLASGVAMGHTVRARVKIGGREKILTGRSKKDLIHQIEIAGAKLMQWESMFAPLKRKEGKHDNN
jgi:hypothetical protein